MNAHYLETDWWHTDDGEMSVDVLRDAEGDRVIPTGQKFFLAAEVEELEKKLVAQEAEVEQLKAREKDLEESHLEILNKLLAAKTENLRLARRVAEVQDIARQFLAALLNALGLGDHARPISPHEVVQREILPAIEQLKVDADYWRRQVTHL